MRSLKFLLPLALFAGIAWFLLQGLSRDPREIPSPLIGKPVPAVSLPLLGDTTGSSWNPAQMRGRVWLLNVWGSWCAGCKTEHPVLLDLARQAVVPIIGMAWKDRPEDATGWLAKLGDPYAVNIADRDGRAAIEWGVYGAPETFVIDREGVVRDRIVGALTPDTVARRLLPLVRRLSAP